MSTEIQQFKIKNTCILFLVTGNISFLFSLNLCTKIAIQTLKKNNKMIDR